MKRIVIVVVMMMFSLMSFCYTNVTVRALEKIKGEYPIVLPARELVFTVGDNVDLYTLVKASDKEDGDIIISDDNTNIIGEINFNVPGSYNLTFEVKDSDGNVSVCALVIIVEEKKNIKEGGYDQKDLEQDPPVNSNEVVDDNQTYRKEEDLKVEVPDTGVSRSNNNEGIFIFIVGGIVLVFMGKKLKKE